MGENLKIIFFILLTVGSLSCSRKRKEPFQPSPSKPAVEKTTPLQSSSPSEKPEREPEEKCVGELIKYEARRRAIERALIKPLIKLRTFYYINEFFENISRLVKAKKFQLIPDTVKKIWTKMKESNYKVTSEELVLLENIVKQRAGAYATCMAIAEDKPGWCGEVVKLWNQKPDNCYLGYSIYGLIVRRAILNNKPCNAVGRRSLPRWLSEKIDSLCIALKQAEPEQCPWEKPSPGFSFCGFAASRARGNYCDQISLVGGHEKDKMCCERFGYRFSNVISRIESSYNFPELGALSGDKRGCFYAFRWGVVEDLNLVFKISNPEEIEKLGESYSKRRLTGEYLCPGFVYWSGSEFPPSH